MCQCQRYKSLPFCSFGFFFLHCLVLSTVAVVNQTSFPTLFWQQWIRELYRAHYQIRLFFTPFKIKHELEIIWVYVHEFAGRSMEMKGMINTTRWNNYGYLKRIECKWYFDYHKYYQCSFTTGSRSRTDTVLRD